MLALAAMAEGIIDSAVTVVQEKRRPEGNQYPAWIERKEAAIVRTIEKIAAAPVEQMPLSIGTLTLGVALAYVSFRLPHIDWRKSYPALAAWLDMISQRESFLKTQPQP